MPQVPQSSSCSGSHAPLPQHEPQSIGQEPHVSSPLHLPSPPVPDPTTVPSGDPLTGQSTLVPGGVSTTVTVPVLPLSFTESAAAREPPGRIKFFSGGRCSFNVSSVFSSSVTCSALTMA